MNKKGFTLIEIVVVIGIFSLLIGPLSTFFVQALQSQKKTLATQEILGQTSYLLDYISRAIRMAKKDLDGSCIPAKTNYQKTAAGIKFLNYNGVCQEFFVNNFQLRESKAGANPIDLTSANLKINSFNITLSGETQTDNIQPKATLFLDIEGKNQSKIKIQTTVSQRNLDIER